MKYVVPKKVVLSYDDEIIQFSNVNEAYAFTVFSVYYSVEISKELACLANEIWITMRDTYYSICSITSMVIDIVLGADIHYDNKEKIKEKVKNKIKENKNEV